MVLYFEIRLKPEGSTAALLSEISLPDSCDLQLGDINKKKKRGQLAMYVKYRSGNNLGWALRGR